MAAIPAAFRGILRAERNLGGAQTDMEPTRRTGRAGWIPLISSLLMVASAAISLAQESPANHSATAKTSSKSAPKKSSDTFTLVGAGDIVGCSDLSGAQATAKLIDAIPGKVFAADDLAYQHRTYEEFVKGYCPTWGRFKARTPTTPANHEYNAPTAMRH